MELESETRLLVMGRRGSQHDSVAHAIGSNLEM